MKNYIVHDTDGNILRTGVCPDDLIESEAGDNQTAIEGIANDVKHIIVGGEIRDKPVDVDAVKAEARERMRVIRNAKLAYTDWTQVPDAPLTETQRASWREYRQALRDLPAQSDIIWPTRLGE